jgi:hypothetical protein
MNSRDQENLLFIKSLNTEQLNQWIDSVSEDDVNYALELVNRDIENLQAELVELRLSRMSEYKLADAVIRSIG